MGEGFRVYRLPNGDRFRSRIESQGLTDRLVNRSNALILRITVEEPVVGYLGHQSASADGGLTHVNMTFRVLEG